MLKFGAVLCLVVVCAHAGYIPEYSGHELEGYGGGHEEISYGGGHIQEHHEEEYHEPKPYKFNYAVHDPHTGDEKSQYEERGHDGSVKGQYSLKEADGTMRIVEYKADKHNGFTAVVHKVGEPKKHEEYASYGGQEHYEHY